MKNTQISYLYRDADNYKNRTTIVVAGLINKEGIDKIIDSLEDGLWFIPEQIGLPVCRFEDITEADHCFCELEEGDFEPTDKEPDKDVTITADELVKKFVEIGAKGWDSVTYAIFPPEEEDEE